VVLSALAAWLGTALGGREAAVIGQREDPAERPSRERAGHGEISKEKEKDKPTAREKIREVLGRTETEVLWQQLLSKEVSWIITAADNALMDELIAREGMGAWKRLLDLSAGEQRTHLSDRMLDRISYKDPWLAYEMFLKERGSFQEGWGRDAGTSILMAASKISADKYIEVMDESGFKETKEIFYAAFSPGFDFGKLVRHLESSEFRAAGMPGNLIQSWAAESPLEAAEYLRSLRKLPVIDEEVKEGELDRNHFLDLPDVLKSMAGSKDGSRNEALVQLAGLPEDDLKGAWKNRAERDEGKLVPEVMDAASVMGQRDDYLVNALLTTRAEKVPDESWKQVPKNERARLLDLAEKQWAEKANAPVDVRARERWRIMMEDAWVEQ